MMDTKCIFHNDPIHLIYLNYRVRQVFFHGDSDYYLWVKLTLVITRFITHHGTQPSKRIIRSIPKLMKESC